MFLLGFIPSFENFLLPCEVCSRRMRYALNRPGLNTLIDTNLENKQLKHYPGPAPIALKRLETSVLFHVLLLHSLHHVTTD